MAHLPCSHSRFQRTDSCIEASPGQHRSPWNPAPPVRSRTTRALLACLALLLLAGAGLLAAAQMEPMRLLFATAAVLVLCLLLVGAALAARARGPLEQPPTDARLRAWIDEAARRPTRRSALGLVGRLARWPNAVVRLDAAERARVQALVVETGAGDELLRWLRRATPKGRRLGALRLAPWLGLAGAERRLAEAVGSRDREVAHAAATALAQYRSPQAYATLLQHLDESILPASRLAALLEGADAAVLLPQLRELAGDPVPQRRFWAAYLLGQHGTGRDAGLLLRLAGDEDENVRANAAEALGAVAASDDADHRSVLHQLLQDPSWVVQAHALKALGRMGAGPSRPRIEPLQDSPHWWVRYRAATALRSNGSVASS